MRPSSYRQRQKILEAATRKFAEHGFLGARVDDIAASAGVNKRLLYHYVGAKAELFAAVLQQQARRLDSSAASNARIWSLILEEAANADESVLFDALVAFESSRDPGRVRSRLAEAMFAALLPAAALSNLDTVQPDSAQAAHKPRLRMMPQVSAAD